MKNNKCPLCVSNDFESFCRDNRREYIKCNNCSLVYVPSEYWLTHEQEKAEYDLHQNDVFDPGYRKFLSRLTKPLQQQIPNGSQGLDFGCGPGPALSKIMEESGYLMDLYDPFYCNDKSVFQKKYNFITATEVIEHINYPYKVIPLIIDMLLSDGWLGIMTKMVIGKDEFSKWHYKNDMTHICFYSRETFEYIANKFSLKLYFFGNDVVLLNKR